MNPALNPAFISNLDARQQTLSAAEIRGLLCGGAGRSNLDGAYAAFGRVDEGMEAADKIVSTPRDMRDKPRQEQKIQSIRVDTFGEEYPHQKL